MNNYYTEIDVIIKSINDDVYIIMKRVKDITLDLNLSTVRLTLLEDDTIRVTCEPHYCCKLNDLPAKILALLADNLIEATSPRHDIFYTAMDGSKSGQMINPPIDGMFF